MIQAKTLGERIVWVWMQQFLNEAIHSRYLTTFALNFHFDRLDYRWSVFCWAITHLFFVNGFFCSNKRDNTVRHFIGNYGNSLNIINKTIFVSCSGDQARKVMFDFSEFIKAIYLKGAKISMNDIVMMQISHSFNDILKVFFCPWSLNYLWPYDLFIKTMGAVLANNAYLIITFDNIVNAHHLPILQFDQISQLW